MSSKEYIELRENLGKKISQVSSCADVGRNNIA